jgi:hypothetical protein
MNSDDSENLFRKVHRIVQERREHVSEEQQVDSERRSARDKEEAKREVFDRA